MPALHPALLELRTELERQGFVVVCHGDYICVRLPLVASVRIRLNGGQLHFEPRFGPFGRGTSLVATPVLAALTVIGAASVAPVAPLVVVAFAATVTILHDIQRLIMTEGAMTRLQLLWSTRQPPKDVLPGAKVSDSLSAPRPAVLPDAPPGVGSERAVHRADSGGQPVPRG